jgi:hypothetical protein
MEGRAMEKQILFELMFGFGASAALASTRHVRDGRWRLNRAERGSGRDGWKVFSDLGQRAGWP